MSRFSNPRGTITPGQGRGGGSSLRGQETAAQQNISEQQLAFQNRQLQQTGELSEQRLQQQMQIARQQAMMQHKELLLKQDSDTAAQKYKRQELDMLRERNATIKEAEADRAKLAARELALDEARAAREAKLLPGQLEAQQAQLSGLTKQNKLREEQLANLRVQRHIAALQATATGLESIRSKRAAAGIKLQAKLAERVLPQLRQRSRAIMRQIKALNNDEAAFEGIDKTYQEALGGPTDVEKAISPFYDLMRLRQRTVPSAPEEAAVIDTIGKYVPHPAARNAVLAALQNKDITEIDPTLADREMGDDLVGVAYALRKAMMVSKEKDLDVVLEKAYQKLVNMKNRRGVPIVQAAMNLADGIDAGSVKTYIAKHAGKIVDRVPDEVQDKVASYITLAQMYQVDPDKSQAYLTKARELVPQMDKEAQAAMTAIEALIETGKTEIGDQDVSLEGISINDLLLQGMGDSK